MKLTIVDKARTTSHTVNPPYPDDLFATMREARGFAAPSSSGQVEFHVDKEFMDALEVQKEEFDPHRIPTPNHRVLHKMHDQLARLSYDGIPIVVTE